MKKFEYKKIAYSNIERGVMAELNKLGQEGWELVIINKGDYIFKREIYQEKKWNRGLL